MSQNATHCLSTLLSGVNCLARNLNRPCRRDRNRLFFPLEAPNVVALGSYVLGSGEHYSKSGICLVLAIICPPCLLPSLFSFYTYLGAAARESRIKLLKRLNMENAVRIWLSWLLRSVWTFRSVTNCVPTFASFPYAKPQQICFSVCFECTELHINLFPSHYCVNSAN